MAATVSESWQSYDRLSRILPESPKWSQIWSHLPPNRRYPEQFPLIFTSLPKGSEGSRRPPGDGDHVTLLCLKSWHPEAKPKDL
jgi:hypothetical protein